MELSLGPQRASYIYTALLSPALDFASAVFMYVRLQNQWHRLPSYQLWCPSTSGSQSAMPQRFERKKQRTYEQTDC